MGIPSALPNDKAVLLVLKRLTSPPDRKSFSLVCRRWLRLHGLATTSVRLYDWSMLQSGRLAKRFPNLTRVDLTGAWSNSADPEAFGPAAVYMSRGGCSMRIDPQALNPFDPRLRIDDQSPDAEQFDQGLRALVSSYPSLRSLHVVDVFRPRERGTRRRSTLRASVSSGAIMDEGQTNGDGEDLVHRDNGGAAPERAATASSSSSNSGRATGGARSPLDTESLAESMVREPSGLEIVARGLPVIQELVVHQCMDTTFEAVSRAAGGCSHLQSIRLVGAMAGFYHAAFSNTGLRKLPRCFPNILELHLSYGDVGLEGLACVAQGCPMLSELHLSGSTFAPDWLQALCLFQSLYTLHLEDFEQLNADTCGKQGHGLCLSIRELKFSQCDLRSVDFFRAILRICQQCSHLSIQGCKGFTDNQFLSLPGCCRNIVDLSLERLPAISTSGLEGVVSALPSLQSLRVSNCGNVKDDEISGPLADVIFFLKVLKWEPASPGLPALPMCTPLELAWGPLLPTM